MSTASTRASLPPALQVRLLVSKRPTDMLGLSKISSTLAEVKLTGEIGTVCEHQLVRQL